MHLQGGAEECGGRFWGKLETLALGDTCLQLRGFQAEALDLGAVRIENADVIFKDTTDEIGSVQGGMVALGVIRK